MSTLGEIVHLYVSPDHNYFGHHGKEPGANPMIETDHVSCVAGNGIVGDRFWQHRENYKGQITFFAIEVYHELCERLNPTLKDPSAFRRNSTLR